MVKTADAGLRAKNMLAKKTPKSEKTKTWKGAF